MSIVRSFTKSFSIPSSSNTSLDVEAGAASSVDRASDFRPSFQSPNSERRKTRRASFVETLKSRRLNDSDSARRSNERLENRKSKATASTLPDEGNCKDDGVPSHNNKEIDEGVSSEQNYLSICKAFPSKLSHGQFFRNIVGNSSNDQTVASVDSAYYSLTALKSSTGAASSDSVTGRIGSQTTSRSKICHQVDGFGLERGFFDAIERRVETIDVNQYASGCVEHVGIEMETSLPSQASGFAGVYGGERFPGS